jgi:tRNA threonylcarbamoyladenosine biosynthesis protein TsaB
LFRISNGEITRLTPDRALLCEELSLELRENYKDEKIIITGDGAKVSPTHVADFATLANPLRIYQSALGVALAAEKAEFVSPEEINPVYLRLPQAERELNIKKANQKES